jgi:hypothetical protein
MPRSHHSRRHRSAPHLVVALKAPLILSSKPQRTVAVRSRLLSERGLAGDELADAADALDEIFVAERGKLARARLKEIRKSVGRYFHKQIQKVIYFYNFTIGSIFIKKKSFKKREIFTK